MATKVIVATEVLTPAPPVSSEAPTKASGGERSRADHGKRQRSVERPKRGASVDTSSRRSLVEGDPPTVANVEAAQNTEGPRASAEGRRGSAEGRRRSAERRRGSAESGRRGSAGSGRRGSTESSVSDIAELWAKTGSNSRRGSNASSIGTPGADDETLAILAESWAEASSKGKDGGKGGGKGGGKSADAGYSGADSSQTMSIDQAIKNEDKKKPQSKGWFGGRGGSKVEAGGDVKEEEQVTQKAAASSKSSFQIPQTFKEMMILNAGMVGAYLPYINIMLEGWEDMMKNMIKTGYPAEFADIYAIRFHRELPKGTTLKLGEFKVCLFASLRSLMPQTWSPKHETAWGWLWTAIEEAITGSLPIPAKYEKAVGTFLMGLNDKQRDAIGLAAWKRMFVKDPLSEHMFRQSNGRLIFIAVKAIEFSGTFYERPAEIHKEIELLGIRHVYNQVQPKYFPLFVESMHDELKEWTDDLLIIDGMIWTLSIVGMTLCRYVIEGGLLKIK